MKILITEDNEDMLKTLASFLKGNDIVLAADLQESMQKVEEKPDLLVTDWNLGAGDTSRDLIAKALQGGAEVIIHTGEGKRELSNIREIYKDDVRVLIIPKGMDSVSEVESEVQKRRLP